MKKRKTEHNSIKMIKAVAIILFLALLFTPEQINRPVIVGIAITGIAGSFLFLLIPMMPHISVPLSLRNTHTHKRKKQKKEAPFFDMEKLLIRQISYQVTDKIKAAYPDGNIPGPSRRSPC